MHAFLLFFVIVLMCPARSGGETMMTLTSPDFQHNSTIPPKFTCQGVGISPNLEIVGTPKEAKSLALIVDDPDAPSGMWIHWVVFNIDPKTTSILEDVVPGVQGWNDFGRVNWGGPCPPRGTHRYFFKIYALDVLLSLRPGASKADVEQAMQGHVLDKSELIGIYKKF